MNESHAANDPQGFRWPLHSLYGLREIELAAARRHLHLAQQQCRQAEGAMQLLQQDRRQQSAPMPDRFDLSRHVRVVAYLADLASRLVEAEAQCAALQEQRARAGEFCLRSVRRLDTLQALRAKAQGQYARQVEARLAREGDATWLARHGQSGAPA